jgi:hypothetical protein
LNAIAGKHLIRVQGDEMSAAYFPAGLKKGIAVNRFVPVPFCLLNDSLDVTCTLKRLHHLHRIVIRTIIQKDDGIGIQGKGSQTLADDLVFIPGRHQSHDLLGHRFPERWFGGKGGPTPGHTQHVIGRDYSAALATGSKDGFGDTSWPEVRRQNDPLLESNYFLRRQVSIN